jgi:transcriptional regulator with XRE-family HTH domain
MKPGYTIKTDAPVTRVPISPLKLARVVKDIRQRDIAEAIHKSTAYVSRLESGRGPATLTPEIAAKIAKVLDVPVVVLFAGRGRNST